MRAALIFAHVLAVVGAPQSRLAVRVARDSPAVPSPTATTAPAYARALPTPHRPPAPATGPASFASLLGRCFSATPDARYEYTACPFANITQREVGGSPWSAFSAVLGVWEGWAANDSSLVGRFSDGTECSGGGGSHREAALSFLCSGPSGATVLKGVTEPRTCSYTMTLACPEACSADRVIVPLLASSVAANAGGGEVGGGVRRMTCQWWLLQRGAVVAAVPPQKWQWLER